MVEESFKSLEEEGKRHKSMIVKELEVKKQTQSQNKVKSGGIFSAFTSLFGKSKSRSRTSSQNEELKETS